MLLQTANTLKWEVILNILFSPEGRFARKHDVLEMELVQWSKINTISVSKNFFYEPKMRYSTYHT
jgi:hypothetical protein